MRLAEFERFCGIYDPLNRRYFRGAVRVDIDTDALLRGNLRPLCPVPVDRGATGGRLLTDFIFAENVAVKLISPRLVAAFKTENFSGWSTYPVTIVSRRVVSEDYVGFAVTGRCGPIDYSGGEWVFDPDYPSRVLVGQGFDLSSWDGSDFFIPENTSRIFVTERVCGWLRREKIKNVKCLRLSEVRTSETVLRSIPHAKSQLKL